MWANIHTKATYSCEGSIFFPEMNFPFFGVKGIPFAVILFFRSEMQSFEDYGRFSHAVTALCVCALLKRKQGVKKVPTSATLTRFL